MRAVVQRVTRAEVRVAGEVRGSVDGGLVALVGAGAGDSAADVTYIANKIAHLRIFADEFGKMNRSVIDINGGVLVVSQFTLYGDVRHARRPSFIGALEPTSAKDLCNQVVAQLRAAGVVRVQTGEFGADMAVELVGDGPVTILIDSHKIF